MNIEEIKIETNVPMKRRSRSALKWLGLFEKMSVGASVLLPKNNGASFAAAVRAHLGKGMLKSAMEEGDNMRLWRIK